VSGESVSDAGSLSDFYSVAGSTSEVSLKHQPYDNLLRAFSVSSAEKAHGVCVRPLGAILDVPDSLFGEVRKHDLRRHP
jgi:hypothetical protein